MKPDWPKPLFHALLQRQSRQLLVAIGRDRQEGEPFCYLYYEGQRSEVVYIYSGFNRYQLWRSYLMAIDKALQEGWEGDVTIPRASEVERA